MANAQVVVIGENVYVGGGDTKTDEDDQQVFQYNPSQDEWSRLPPHPMAGFAMAQFTHNLITVGGVMPDHYNSVTRKVYRFIEQSQEWEKFLKPMPTARYQPSVATTQSAIVASGGATGFREGKPVPCTTVEVYNSETSQWHTADPLLIPCMATTSVTIADTWYQLGAQGTDGENITTVLYTPLTDLIQKPTSPTDQSASHTSVWKTLPDTPLKLSTVATLSGNLLALGGWDDKTPASPAVHIFYPSADSWVRATTADLPEPRYACTAVQLPSNQLLVVGGYNTQDKCTKTVFLGSVNI